MNATIFRFVGKLLLLTAVVFGMHLGILHLLELPLFAHKIVLAYLLNVVMAILVFSALFLLKEKLKNQLGFLFILGSLVKFVLFFVLFYGDYYQDDLIEKSEFFAFFIPYILTLGIEVFSLSQWLNKVE